MADLFSYQPAVPPDGDRDGATYDPKLDFAPLNRQQRAVWEVMIDGRWRALQMIADITDYPPASVSARLRDFRKGRFGGHTVERRREGRLWLYRLVKNPDMPE